MNRLIVARSRRVAAARLSSASFRGGATRGAASAVVDLASTEERTDNDDGRFSIKGTFREGRAVYLDSSATTPLDPRVLEKMMPYMVRCLVGWRKIPKTIYLETWDNLLRDFSWWGNEIVDLRRGVREEGQGALRLGGEGGHSLFCRYCLDDHSIDGVRIAVSVDCCPRPLRPGSLPQNDFRGGHCSLDPGRRSLAASDFIASVLAAAGSGLQPPRRDILWPQSRQLFGSCIVMHVPAYGAMVGDCDRPPPTQLLAYAQGNGRIKSQDYIFGQSREIASYVSH